MIAFLRDTLITFTIAAIIFFGLQSTVQTFIINGPSMSPSFHNDQRLLVSKVVYKFQEPARGDVIIFHPPPENGRGDYIKRIIGLPGETIEIKEGKVYIHSEDNNMVALDEPYTKGRDKDTFKGDKIPENQYFVLGDNRINSTDSRNGWTLPAQDIIGKAWLSIWPSDKWGRAANHSFQE